MSGPGGRPLRAAVVGSGPSGFYAAEALLRHKDLPARVDMFDRLPTPYGLVRGGVAPDHQKIKSVVLVYERIASAPEFRFFGNVRVGEGLSAAELARHYDQVVWAVGNESDRRLGVPGEDLAGSHSATAFVGWYNGHPDHRENSFDLSCERAAVIGVGNVAMDVTRILARDPAELAKTDIADYALEALRRSRVREVFLLGRRGPAQAAFSPAEIQEIGELSRADLVVDPKELALDSASEAALAPDPEARRIVDYLREVARRGEGSRPNKVRLRFCVSPAELLGEGGRVRALRLEGNALVPDGKGGVKARGTGRFETVPVGLVFRSVGYRGVPVPGVPFDEKSGRIPNDKGRVFGSDGKPLPGHYVVGWAKRGPSGLIGTNRADSVATVAAMLEDAKAGAFPRAAEPDPEALPRLLRARGLRFVTFQDWKRLDALERERGAAQGKVREKFSRVPEMLAALGGG